MISNEKEHSTRSERETRALAVDLASVIARTPGRCVVLGLTGDLGAGKTTFVRAFARAMGIKKRILSPTFLIMKRFPLPPDNRFRNLFHIDAYRIGVSDLRELGIEEVLQGQNIVLVEWADREARTLPRGTIWLRFKHGDKANERKITINRR